VDIPSRLELLHKIRGLPAAAPLLRALADADGVHLVGGAVRDLLLGGAPVDLDLVAERDVSAIAGRLGGEVTVHDRFATCTVSLDGYSYDLARARRERYPAPGALPEVEPASLAEDLLRRDFTVNAAAIALGADRPGKLSAAPGALEDLDGCRLRVLHDRSFEDDPTRLLRLARYASRLRFEVEPHTRELAQDALGEGALGTVSGPRIGAELRLLARERDPVAALGALRALGLDRAIAPGFGLEDPELAAAAIELLPADGRRDLLALAVAARGVEPHELEVRLDSLAFEAGDRDVIVAAATRAGAVAATLVGADASSEIAAVLRGSGPELAALAGALGPAQQARRWIESLRGVELEIDGGDLLAAGIPEGPAIGRGLSAALAAKLDGRARGRDAELAEALRGAR
jgi:tRNA nucleotidyltransferase (CCA-adding enzyme)